MNTRQDKPLPASDISVRNRCATYSRLPLFACCAVSSLALALGACQTPPTKSSPTAWRVEPLMRVLGTAQNADAQYQLGRYYDGQGRADRALQAYRQAIKLNPKLAEAHNRLGVLLAQQGRMDEAVGAFEAALAEKPDMSHVLSNLGYAYLLAGRNDAAIATLTRAVRLDGENAKARANLALAQRRSGLPDTVATSVAPDPALAPNPSMAADSAQLAPPAVSVLSKAEVQAVEVAPNIYELRREVSSEPAAIAVAALPTTTAAGVARHYSLEVANGIGVGGAARRVGNLLQDAGAPVARLRNQKPFRKMQTTVQFVSGYQAEAEQIAHWLGLRATPTEAGGLPNAEVRVVVGRDLIPMLAGRLPRNTNLAAGPRAQDGVPN